MQEIESQEESKGLFYSARQAIKHHMSGGNVLILVTILAFVIANIPSISGHYSAFWQQEVRFQLGDFNLFSHGEHPMTLLQFINDALMAIFFFSIGLEIKREVLVGELSSIKKALLPIIAAFGGMIVPVLVFMFFGYNTNYAGGSAIPMATDIAFSLGVLGMLRSRVPISLKVFLTTLAVVDDIGGIVVIAIFYSSHINIMMLVYAALLLGLLLLGSYMKIKSKMFYIFVGIVVWFFFLNSGIHSTIAGVLVAFCVPATPVYEPSLYIKKIKKAISHISSDDVDLNKRSILTNKQIDWLKQVESASDKVISPLQDLEDTLSPMVNYLIIPLFAFANAGVVLTGLDISTVFSGVSLAIICGLVIGKVVGIFSFSWMAIKMRIVPMPKKSNWKMLLSVAMLGGIGFTVSIFIANLSFGAESNYNAELLNQSKLGIVVGSIVSGVLGYILLRINLPKENKLQEPNEDE